MREKFQGGIVMKSIEMAINKLNLDLNEVHGVRTFTTALEDYLETVFHQQANNGGFKYFNTIIELSINDDDEISIKRYDDGDRYVWVLKPANPDIPIYYHDYHDGFFNSNDCDEYVGNALWQLLEALNDNGMIRLNKEMLLH
jgi:hypothetical protein